jgi:hypothetical protein
MTDLEPEVNCLELNRGKVGLNSEKRGASRVLSVLVRLCGLLTKRYYVSVDSKIELIVLTDKIGDNNIANKYANFMGFWHNIKT